MSVLHEYITTCIDKEESSHAILGDYHVDSGPSGSRNKDLQKYTNDAAVLEHGYNEEMGGAGDRALAERYAFYCKQIVSVVHRETLGGWRGAAQTSRPRMTVTVFSTRKNY